MHWAVKINDMIHGTTVFSMADLSDMSGWLYGKYKYRKNEYEVECLEEHQNNGTTHCRIRGVGRDSDSYEDIKTDKIYDMQHSDRKLW